MSTRQLLNSDLQQKQSQLQIKGMSAVTLSGDEYLKKYREMRNKLSLPLKIKLYFSILEASLEDETVDKSITQTHKFSNLFYAVFSCLSKTEKTAFLYGNLLRIKYQFQKVYNGSCSYTPPKLQNLNVGAQMSENILGLVYWTSVKFSFAAQERKVRIEAKKKTIEYDLRLYLVRKSKKYKNTIVIEAVSDAVPADQCKVYCSFKNSIFAEVYDNLFSCVLEYRNEQLIKIQSQKGLTLQKFQNPETTFSGKNAYPQGFLGAGLINEYLSFKEKAAKKIGVSSLYFQDVYQDKKIIIERSISHPDFYRMEASFDCSGAVLRQQFMKQYLEQSCSYLLQSQALEKYSEKYSALYQKHLIHASEGSIVVTQHIMIEQLNFQKENEEEVVFLKSINNVMAKKLIDFICVKIKKHETHNQKSKLLVYGGFNIMKKSNSKGFFGGLWNKLTKTQAGVSFQENELITKLLLEYSEMLFRQEEGEHLSKLLVGLELGGLKLPSSKENGIKETSLETIQGTTGFATQQEFVLDIDNENDNQNEFEEQVENCNINQANSNSTTQYQQNYSPATYLKNKYRLQPKPIQGEKEIVKDHFIFTEWNRKSKGGIACKDEKPINEQKKVFKFLVKNMGKNILESKGIMNVSLPVTIFRPESHLQSVARNFGFAPLLLEKAVSLDPVQKMKMTILYSLSVSIFSISVSKPFNPILGETHQAWIDGCPVYLQQISHHPPIVSYLFLGRGYKAYGRVGPKATFGFNILYGYSQQPNYVVFDDGTKIQVNFGKMAIKGIMFGDRQFNFAEKMYAFDAKNKLFSELTFGQQKKMFSSSSQPQDYFSGRIVEVEENFVANFYKQDKIIYPEKNNISRTVSTYDGIWAGKIKFDGTEYIDFGTSNPCVMTDQEFSLPSDSIFRPDIRYLKENNIQESQKSKQKLQEIQRRDRKLREKMGS